MSAKARAGKQAKGAGKGKAAQHDGNQHLSHNHYTRSVSLLEGVLEERLAELSLLVAENSALKQREAALQSAIGSLAGSVSAATRAVLASGGGDDDGAAAANGAAACAGGGGNGRAQSPAELSATACLARFCSSSIDGQSFLQSMQQRELAVQRVMQQLGGIQYDELYSSYLLRRAFSDPSRAASYLAMPTAARIEYVLGTVHRLGLLVGKYALEHHPATSAGTPRQQLDALVDDLNERTLAFCLLAPPRRQLEMACLNLETRLPEPYPEGWWAVVIDAMQLTQDQKDALKICWEKVRPIKLALTQQHEELSARLAELQQAQLDQQRQFEVEAEHIMDEALNLKSHRQQQQQVVAAAAPATAAAAPQQQQQQELLPRTASDQEAELLDFCRVLLGGEANFLEGPACTPFAADAQQQQLFTPQPYGPSAQPVDAQQPGYAARILPKQEQAPGRQFTTFSPAVAAAAAAADQGVWLQGVVLDQPASNSGSGGSGGGSGRVPRPRRAAAAAAAAGELELPPLGGTPARSRDVAMGELQQPAVSASRSGDSQTSSGVGGGGGGRSSAARSASRSSLDDGSSARATTSNGGTTSVPLLQGPARSALSFSDTQSQRALLLQVSSQEQQQLEQQLDRITSQLKLQQYCMHTYVLNICSKLQVAKKYVACWPYAPESISFMEAMDDMGW